ANATAHLEVAGPRSPRVKLRVGHSPDSDDAFMAWPLASGLVKDDAFESIELVQGDIQSLNERAMGDDPLEVTAISAAAMTKLSERYLVCGAGASFGEGYGPILVRRKGSDARTFNSASAVAVPGEFTTARAAMHIAHPLARLENVPFDDIAPGVAAGKYDLGVVIHEAQLTFERDGLEKLLDLGEWWKTVAGVPLPLGLVAVRRDLGDLAPAASRLIARSVTEALAHREEALAYAARFARGATADETARFVSMYVTDLTRDMGEVGRGALKAFLKKVAPEVNVGFV
ncbi:MAG: menaquinone biosynthesis family protein, partial [Thermoplasmatota archaeon]